MFGATVSSSFNPYQEQFTSTNTDKLAAWGEEKDKYDHQSIDQMIKEEKINRHKAMEKEVEDRGWIVFAPSLSKQEVTQKLKDLDEITQQQEELLDQQALTRSYKNLIS